MKFSKEKEKLILDDYLSGLSTVKIAEKWNTYNTSIRRVLLRNKITPRNLKESLRTVNENPFKLGDEKSEYFLGLLLTDGNIYHRKNINSVSISLSLKDEDLVKEFREFVCPKNKVSKVLQKKYSTYMYTVSVKQDSIANWLEQNGNFYNKSYNCDIYIPLTSHILRGIFDGDGYWHRTNNGNTIQWGICGKSYIFLYRIYLYLQGKSINSYIRKRNTNTGYLYYLEVYRTVDVIKVANLMYKEAHIYLLRKYDKWHLFEETLREKFSKFKEGEAYSNPEPSYNESYKLYNKNNGRFIMEGAETIMELLNINCMEKG